MQLLVYFKDLINILLIIKLNNIADWVRDQIKSAVLQTSRIKIT